MAAQKGKDLLVKLADGASLVTVAGLRARQIAFNAETVDVNDSESTGRWRELLAGAGMRRGRARRVRRFFATHSRTPPPPPLIRGLFFDGEAGDFSIVIPDFGTVSGPFQIISLDIGVIMPVKCLRHRAGIGRRPDFPEPVRRARMINRRRGETELVLGDSATGSA